MNKMCSLLQLRMGYDHLKIDGSLRKSIGMDSKYKFYLIKLYQYNNI